MAEQVRQNGAIENLDISISNCLERAKFVRDRAGQVGSQIVGYSGEVPKTASLPPGTGAAFSMKARVCEIQECLDDINRVLDELR